MENTNSIKLRLWPGIILGIILIIIRYLVPVLASERMDVAFIGGLLCSLLIIIWWAFFSKAPHWDRWGSIILIIAAIFLTPFGLHKSIATGNMGLMFLLHSMPIYCLTLVILAIATKGLSTTARRFLYLGVILLISAFWMILRSTGINGDGTANFTWRWIPTPEELLLAQPVKELNGINNEDVDIQSNGQWTGFRGLNRDDIIQGISLSKDWKKNPPTELWHQPVGPACSSFAVLGKMLYTQEQRGEEELVSCYNLTTGKPIWKHSDKARFWDSHAGAGPRATPLLFGGKLYTLGATGILNKLDATNGSLIWTHNVATETKTKSPVWAFSGSPLLWKDIVIVPIAGTLIACDTTTGNQRWVLSAGGDCYSSPHLLTVDGVQQILFLNESGLSGINPENGKVLWKYAKKGNPILQPAMTAEGNILVSTNPYEGLHCIKVSKERDVWKIKELWTSTFQPNHNDFVIHKGFIYGLDASGIQCVDIKTGIRKWKGNRYGGQLLLLADNDALMVLSEKGDIAMVQASPDQFKELAKIPAIKGRTWNHPALSGDVLIVRNSDEMAAFRLKKENKG